MDGINFRAAGLPEVYGEAEVMFQVVLINLFLLAVISEASVLNQVTKNILGEPLKIFSVKPMTGFYRDGYCRTGEEDSGTHVVAAIVDQKFLDYTKSKGNDLQTPNLAFGFVGLKPGDRWCLCATRWKQAHEAGFAPAVDLEATHEKALEYISLETLKLKKNK